MISKIVIHNYKKFSDFELDLDDDLNIIVGDNETGKSTILEAINLALTKRLNGKFIETELSPYLFHTDTVEKFIVDLKAGKNPAPPDIFIELYFKDIPALASFRGNNNSKREDQIGIRLEIVFNEDFCEEYDQFIKGSEINLLPIEYYKINWCGFDGNARTQRSIPIWLSFIDATIIRLQSGTDYYLQNIINEGLDTKERAQLALTYRQLKEEFSKHDSITEINKTLDTDGGTISDKKLTISLDVSQRANWETNLVPHLNEIPSQYSGKGEQNSLKIMLALKKKADKTNIILIEEPENHLSFASMNKLLTKIQEKCIGKQIIIATHSSFVLNKLGLEKLILIANTKTVRLRNLPKDTQDYFKRLSGYDTLRLILAKKILLVEGPSDELIVQRAYLNKHKRFPIQDGIDVLSVRGLSFKRFLDIAKELDTEVSLVTDNDGDYKSKVENKYKDYLSHSNIKIHFDKDDLAYTLEPQIVKCNDLRVLNKILEKSFGDKKSLLDYMEDNKTEWALRLFDTKEEYTIPEYIKNAIS